MNKNIKRILFVTTLLILLFAISSVSANDVSEDTTTVSNSVDTVTTTDADTTNTITSDNTVTNTATKDNNKNIEETDVEKQVDNNISDMTLENKKEEKNENNIPTVNNEKNLKNDGEPTVIDVTEDNYSDWFGDNPTRWELIYNKIDSSTIFNISYVPETVTNIMISPMGVSNNFKDYTISFVGNNLTLTNVYVMFIGYNFVLSDFNLVYDENYVYDDDIGNDIAMVLGDMGNNYSFLVDNVNINFSPEYSSEDPILRVLYVNQPNSNITYQNSEININVPVTDDGIPLFEFCKKVKFINNTINIHETVESGDDFLLTAFYAGQSDSWTSTDENEFENNIISIELPDDSEAEVCAIQLLSSNNILNNNTITITSNSNVKAIELTGNSNTITNNNIIITSTGTANGVELTGNDNTVKNNKISANDKTGNDAVTATGENNIVENNTAPETDTRIPTSIELNYDGTPIDVGQRLIIRGIFKADNTEASAEGIKVYDNNELLATINADEYGTITYGYTPTVGGNHNITFSFDGNDTHQDTSTSINVKVNGGAASPIVNITVNNFYDYFDSEGELYHQNLTNDTTFYFYSIPEEVNQISLTKVNKNTTGRNLTFAGTDDFILTNKAVIIESNLNNFKLVNMTIIYTDEYQEQDYILIQNARGTNESYIDNCNIIANITRQIPKGYPYSVISSANTPIIVSNSTIIIYTIETSVDWEPASDNYGNNNVIPIYGKYMMTLINNTIQIFAQEDGSGFPTLYGIRLGGHASVMADNNITISGGGWLYAIQPYASGIEIYNNNINISGTHYTAGIMIEGTSNCTIDNNTIVLTALTENIYVNPEPCTYGIVINDYMCGGYAYSETGYAANNRITNNNLTCTAFNMYGIEEFGGSNTTIENNTVVATGDTAMGIGVIGVNILINNNNIEVNGQSFSGKTVDFLGAKTTGVYIGRGSNATLANNTINSTYDGIYTQAQHTANINNNNITTRNYTHSIILDADSQNEIIENNVLVTPGRLGNESVKDYGKNNTVQNNQPIPEKQYFLKVDTTEFTAGTTTTITASIYYGTEYTQTVATNITKGKITFKVNGKTLKDANGKVIYAKIVNGTATIEDYEVPESWAKEGTTIQAVYSGSSDLEKMTSDKEEITITATEPTITTEDITASAGETITLTATINTGTTVNNGKVVFKINGKTVKDTNGKVIYAKVSNNQVNFTYTLPADMKAKEYNLTATFISSDYERIEDTKTLTITA